MNELPPHKRAVLKRLLAAGGSVRAIAATVRCSPNTVTRYADMWVLSAQCGCGKAAGHNGWCRVRLDFSPVRRGWLHERWKTRGDRQLAQTVDAAIAAARDLGHDLGQFMWASATAASFAFALCKTCGKEVRIFGGHSQWERYRDWQRFAGSAVTIRCKTQQQRVAEAAMQQEKRQWREGKRTLSQLKKTLRNQSCSPSAAFTPGPTSPR